MSDLTVFASTFNLNTRGSSLTSTHLQHWLRPAFSGDHGSTAPDLVVIGVQELIPLHKSLSGFGATFIANFQESIVAALNTLSASLFPSHSASFASVAPRSDYRATFIGSIILLVFHNTQSLPAWKLGRPSIARLGLGVGSTYGLNAWSDDCGGYGMGNKGAVGLRIPINRGENEEYWETFTFVCAHLAAHDENLATRNANYRQILSSLLFTPSSSLDKPLRVWQTSHLILLGDLNYRLESSPTGLEKALVDTPRQGDDVQSVDPDVGKERNRLVALDTLKQQQARGKAFEYLSEGDLATFAPTYKRIIGQVDGYNEKRRPGYTDRILFASYRGGSRGQGDSSEYSGETSPLLASESTTETSEINDASQTRIISYNSIPDLTVSDHKPVYAVLKIPGPPSDIHDRYSTQHQTPFLSFPAAATVPATDALSLGIRQAIATASDRSIGLLWYATLILGAGNLPAGIVVELLLLAVGWTWWMGMW